jgi:hypothetical protein
MQPIKPKKPANITMEKSTGSGTKLFEYAIRKLPIRMMNPNPNRNFPPATK